MYPLTPILMSIPVGLAIDLSPKNVLFIKPQARANLRALVGAAALGSTVGLAIGGAYLAGGLARATVVHAQIQRLAGAASGGFSDIALNAATSENDPATLAIARRHDPSTNDNDPRERQVAALVDRLQARQAARSVGATQTAELAQKPVVQKAAFVRPTLAAAAAEPFHLRGALDQSRDLECLTQAVYYEARGEPRSGQQAVAQVILNRVRHPAFPKSVCGVVFQGAKTGGCQFSFACDNQPHHPMENAAWRRAESVAAEALDGQVMAEVGDATHFHVAGSGSGWGAGLLKVAQIGAHVFYRFGGHNGSPSMFHGQPLPSDGSASRPVFASLALPNLGSAPSPAQFVASASAAVEHAASVVETVAKGVTTPEPAKAATVQPSAPAAKPPAAPTAVDEKPAPTPA
jgi:spore germination cell wall hydrolase CwlJ-like protein